MMGFVEADPNNPRLRFDASSLALAEREFDLAADLLEDATLDQPDLLNLKGVAALSLGHHDDASAAFAALREAGHDDAPIRFNLAWARAMLDDFAAADDLLDDEAIAASSRGPGLKVRALHHLERYEDGLTIGQRLAARYPDNGDLMGALATLAMDADELELAKLYAGQATDNSEGLAALGMLILEDGQAETSLALFDRALELQPGNPRAWVGKGLMLLNAGDPAAGAQALLQGAELFGDHLGSWIAAGWAQYVGGQAQDARATFEHALALDPTFAESHGALAVLDIADGRLEDASRRCETALRLDRQCLGGALAQSLLLDSAGKSLAAERVRAIALSSPIGTNGQTLAEAISRFSKPRAGR